MPLLHDKSPKAASLPESPGKSKDQSLAIAYSVQRRNRKMASGSAVASTKPMEQDFEEPQDKPTSIVEMIRRKRQAQKLALESSPAESDDDFSSDLDLFDEPEELTPEPAAPDPKDLVSKVRARLKASRGF